MTLSPRMSDRETALFESFAARSEDYLEFGSGGSTVRASQLVGSSIISIDSSAAWLEKVSTHCREIGALQPTTILIDIGDVGDWGYPTNEETKPSWPNYHSAIWNDPRSRDVDLFLVDGRFRVACFLQIVIHCQPDAFIIVHDYRSRTQYHAIESVAREIATAEDLSIFVPFRGAGVPAQRLLRRFRYDPS